MKLDKVAPFLLGALILAGAGLIVVGLGLFKKKAAPKGAAVPIELQHEIQKYKADLANPEASPESLSLALDRLSLRTDPDVKNYIKKYWTHPSTRVRAAAVEAAGSFLNDGFLPMVKEGLGSPEISIRVAALRGLSRQGGKQTEELALNYLRRQNLSQPEVMQANLTLLRVAPEPGERQQAIGALLMFAAKEPDILMNLYTLAPNEPKLITKAKELIEARLAPEFLAPSIQYLTAWDKSWMREHLSRLPMHENLNYQLVILDSLRSLCPENKNEVLGEVRKAKPGYAQVKAALRDFSCPIR